MWSPGSYDKLAATGFVSAPSYVEAEVVGVPIIALTQGSAAGQGPSYE